MSLRITRLAENMRSTWADEMSVLRTLSVPGLGPKRARRLRMILEVARWLRDDPIASNETFELLRLRTQIPLSETLLCAYKPWADQPPLTLSIGVGLHQHSPIGGYLSHLVSSASDHRWLVLFRLGGPPTSREQESVKRIWSVAMLLGIELEKIFIVAADQYWELKKNNQQLGIATNDPGVVREVESDV